MSLRIWVGTRFLNLLRPGVVGDQVPSDDRGDDMDPGDDMAERIFGIVGWICDTLELSCVSSMSAATNSGQRLRKV